MPQQCWAGGATYLFCLSMEDLRVFNLFCRYAMIMYFKYICNTFGKRMPWCISSWKTTNWLLWKVTMTLIRLVITTCWQDWSALISGKQKLDQRKTMQNWNCRAPQELQFGKAHIIAFSQNNKRSICDFSTGSFSLFCLIHRFHFPPYSHFDIYILSGMLFNLKYIPNTQNGL